MSLCRIALLLLWPALSVAGCGDDNQGDAGQPLDLSVPVDRLPALDESVPVDLLPTPDLSVPRDLMAPPDIASSDACVPNVGPGCCYPTCKPDEELVCLGANICGYPCHCEAVLPAVTAVVESVKADEGCMPIIPPDPLSFAADVTFENAAKADSPPMQLGGGAALDGKDQLLGRFGLTPVADFVVPGGGRRTVHVVKSAGSLQPANQCQTIPCFSSVKWRITWGTRSAPSARSSTSNADAMQCVF